MNEEKKSEKISEAMNGIGDDLIRDAQDNVPVKLKPKKRWVKWVAAAAAVILVALSIPAVFLAVKLSNNNNQMSPEPVVKPITESGIKLEDRAGTKAKESRYDASDGRSSVKGAPAMEAEAGIEHAFTDGKSGDPYPIEVITEINGEEPQAIGDPEVIEEPKTIEPGQLTAAAWNDNDHFRKWLDLFKNDSGQGGASGKFADELNLEQNGWNFPVKNRIKVTVTSNGETVRNASVTCQNTSAVTDANGVAYLFLPSKPAAGTVITVKSGASEATVTYDGANDVAADLSDKAVADNRIELVYLVDVTGSMGDEIAYIKRELQDVIETVVRDNQGVAIRLGFVFYRDEYDDVEFSVIGLNTVATAEGTDEEALKKYLDEIKQVDAYGGDDFPEALDEALTIVVNELDWSDSAATKLVFHVFDAPSHEEPENVERYQTTVAKAAEKGIRICPVLSSGADTFTEYQARSEAILTGGTFVYLTDDSGIGFAHHDPEIEEAVHEYLNALMVRLVNGYHTGTFAEPVAWYNVTK